MVVSYFKPSEQFIENFNLYMTHYGCTKEEAKYEKQRITESAECYFWADKCYSLISEEIRNEQ